MRTLQLIDSKELKEFLDKHPKVLISIHEPLRGIKEDEIEQRICFYSVDGKGNIRHTEEAFYLLFTEKREISGAV